MIDSDGNDIPTLRRLLLESRRIAVVGVSADWHRPSYFVAKYLLVHGYLMIPVNPRYDRVLGQQCYSSLIAAAQGGPIDMVDCFRKSADIDTIVDEAIQIGARVIWMQLGVSNLAAATRARDAGIAVVMNRCVKIEHARLFGGLNWVGVNTRVVSSRRPKQLPY